MRLVDCTRRDLLDWASTMGCALVTAMLAACAGVIVREVGPESMPRGYYQPVSQDLARHNVEALSAAPPSPVASRPYEPDNLPKSREWDWNRTAKGEPPAVCLAMSGGGIRSAAFNVGVMKALGDLGILDRLDVASAVSGGAYALSWYLAQRASDPQPDQTMFQDGSAQMRHLLGHSRITTEGDVVATVLANAVLAPVNLFANGIFGWHLNIAIGRDAYEGRIADAFLTTPAARRPAASRVLTPYTVGRKTIGNAPFFIINATALIEQDIWNHGAKLRNSVFEFTPLQYGSDAFGYFRYPDDVDATAERREVPPITLARAVSISGAAWDTVALASGPSQTVFGTAFNQDLGFYLTNPALRSETRLAHTLLPFPLYYFHHYKRDAIGTHIYLSDGGFSENLGAFALVRRLCRSIIMVDAEHDPYYRYEAYYHLKDVLAREMGVSFRIPDIEGGRRHPDLQRSADGPRCEAKQSVKDAPYLGEAWKRAAARPVMTGTICCLPYGDRHSRRETISVAYVKLAAWHLPTPDSVKDANALSQAEYLSWLGSECRHEYPRVNPERFTESDEEDLVQGYFRCIIAERERKPHLPGLKADPFPQQRTTDQNFSATQFRAYMALGRRIVFDQPGRCALLSALPDWARPPHDVCPAGDPLPKPELDSPLARECD